MFSGSLCLGLRYSNRLVPLRLNTLMASGRQWASRCQVQPAVSPTLEEIFQLNDQVVTWLARWSHHVTPTRWPVQLMKPFECQGILFGRQVVAIDGHHNLINQWKLSWTQLSCYADLHRVQCTGIDKKLQPAVCFLVTSHRETPPTGTLGALRAANVPSRTCALKV